MGVVVCFGVYFVFRLMLIGFSVLQLLGLLLVDLYLVLFGSCVLYVVTWILMSGMFWIYNDLRCLGLTCGVCVCLLGLLLGRLFVLSWCYGCVCMVVLLNENLVIVAIVYEL